MSALLRHSQVATFACGTDREREAVWYFSPFSVQFVVFTRVHKTMPNSKRAIFSSGKLSPGTQAYFPGRFP